MKLKRIMAVAISIICTLLLVGCDDVKYNNQSNVEELISEEYTHTQIEELTKAIEISKIHFSEFEKRFNTQCTRKTHQGYYVILQQEDGNKVFVFFNNDLVATNIIYVDEFLTKEEFEKQANKITTKNEMLLFDSDTILLPVSSVEITAHHVQEGVFLIRYSRFQEGEILEEPIVSSIDFYDNETIPKSEDLFIRENIPFILQIDKIAR